MTIVLAVAMLAFVLGDLFSSGSIFASRQSRVGKINGETIDYQVYLNQTENVKNIYSMLWGSTAFNAEQYDMIYDEAWSELIMTHAFAPSFENLGLTVSDAEIVDMIQGEYMSPLIASFFADPQTGVFSAEAFAGCPLTELYLHQDVYIPREAFDACREGLTVYAPDYLENTEGLRWRDLAADYGFRWEERPY